MLKTGNPDPKYHVKVKGFPFQSSEAEGENNSVTL